MSVSEAKKRANAKWNASKDNIMIRPSKEEGAKIREAAGKANQSVQKYILQAVKRRMEQDEKKRIPAYFLEKCPKCNGYGYFYDGQEPENEYSALRFAIEHRGEVTICTFCNGTGLNPSD